MSFIRSVPVLLAFGSLCLHSAPTLAAYCVAKVKAGTKAQGAYLQPKQSNRCVLQTNNLVGYQVSIEPMSVNYAQVRITKLDGTLELSSIDLAMHSQNNVAQMSFRYGTDQVSIDCKNLAQQTNFELFKIDPNHPFSYDQTFCLGGD